MLLAAGALDHRRRVVLGQSHTLLVIPGIESYRRNLHASFVQDYKFSRRVVKVERKAQEVMGVGF
jgi:hypothetical protein